MSDNPNPHVTGDTVTNEMNQTSPSLQGDEGNAKVGELEATISDMRERMQKQSAIMGQLTNRLGALDKLLEDKRGETPTPKQPNQAEPDSNGLGAQFEALKSQQTEMAEYAKRQRITEALIASGIDAATASQGAKWISLEHKGEIEATFANGEFIVSHQGAGIESFIAGYLETPAGSLLKPAKVSPTPNALRGNAATHNSGKTKIGSIEYAKILSTTPRDQRAALAEQYEIED